MIHFVLGFVSIVSSLFFAYCFALPYDVFSLLFRNIIGSTDSQLIWVFRLACFHAIFISFLLYISIERFNGIGRAFMFIGFSFIGFWLMDVALSPVVFEKSFQILAMISFSIGFLFLLSIFF